MRRLLILILVCAAALAQAPSVKQGTFENQPAVVLSSDKIELTVTTLGASFAKLLLRDDSGALNPLWEPVRMARESGAQAQFRGSTGHFICVDGFGPTSAAERAAGLPGHGEAHLQPFETRRSGVEGRAAVVALEATLPIVQEKFTRTLRLVEGENVVYADSRLENLMGFDRPVNWAEHATVGSPFLESGAMVVDVSGSRSMTRPYAEAKPGASQRRLASGKEFTWPLAPGLDGKPVDLRETPGQPHYLDHATTLVDPNLKHGWTTALHTGKHLVVGYLFRREEYPWVQYWGNYPPTGRMSRGLEFSTQPFDVSRREVLSSPPLFGAPMVRWLPAKSAIETRFLMFYARTPEGMRKIDSVRLENGKLILEDRAAGKTLTLSASLGL
ncbi:MAG: hypothetical protein HY822_21610 [Acidobacteria bacterium]|nr:hypothetical protein [Acidobacteriota bacterium]